MLSAWHVFRSTDNCNNLENTTYQWGDKTGPVKATVKDDQLDYVTLDEGVDSYDSTIRWDGTKYEVGGRAINYAYYMDQGETIYKEGRNAGSATGVITDTQLSMDEGCWYWTDGVRCGNNQAGGDSGTVTWVLKEDDL